MTQVTSGYFPDSGVKEWELHAQKMAKGDKVKLTIKRRADPKAPWKNESVTVERKWWTGWVRDEPLGTIRALIDGARLDEQRRRQAEEARDEAQRLLGKLAVESAARIDKLEREKETLLRKLREWDGAA